MSKPILIGLASGVALSALVGLGVAEAVPAASDILPLSEVKPGMKGYGLTVFSGTKPEKFDVEVISVLKSFRPAQDLILIKTPNHPRLDVAHTVAGMSGSPIYLDGKMIGAYAYGWTFGAEPIAGVTPIQNMLDDLNKPVPPLFRPRAGLLPRAGAGAEKRSGTALSGSLVSPSPRGFAGLFEAGSAGALGYDLGEHAKQLAVRSARERGVGASGTLAPASTPVLFGGMTPTAMSVVGELLRPMGLEPLQTGGGGKAVAEAGAPAAYEDGGAIAVQLIRGDVSAMGLGTVTRVAGDKLVAFGHPMLGGGASDLPTAIAKVHWILASSNRSFKIGEAVRPLGTLVNDRQASIVIDTKRTASSFPVGLSIEGVDGAPKTRWDSIVAHDPFMAPMLAAMAVGNALETTTAERGDMTWRATTKLAIGGYGTVEIRDFGASAGDPISADAFVRSRVVRAMGSLLNNPWEEVRIDGVETKVKVTYSRDVALIRGTKVVDEELDPGQPARIEITLVPFLGKPETRTIEVPIPDGYVGKDVDIEISPGYEVERPRPAPESVADLVAGLVNPSFPEESLVTTVRLEGEGGAAFRGQVATRLPPRAVDALRVSASSIGPETFGAVQQTAHPMKRFVVGRDRVRVRVRPNVK